MADDLGARLLRAGLVTRDQLAQTLAHGPAHGGALIAALGARGVPEDALAGFFLADGFGPLMDATDLAKADRAALDRLPGAMAAELLALPVRSSPAGLVVAMAAPSDRHAVREIGRAVGGDVLPTVACASALRSAIASAYPGVEVAGAPDEREPPPESEPPVLELVRKRGTPSEGVWAGPAREAAEKEGKLGLGPRLAPGSDDDVAVPLVRTKPMVTPAGGIHVSAELTAEIASKITPKVITKSFARPEGKKPSGTSTPAAKSTPGAPAPTVAGYGEKRSGGTKEYGLGSEPAPKPAAAAKTRASSRPPPARDAKAAPAAAKDAKAAPAAAKDAKSAAPAKVSSAAPASQPSRPGSTTGAEPPSAGSSEGSAVPSRAVASAPAPEPPPATTSDAPPAAPESGRPRPGSIVPPEHERWDVAGARAAPDEARPAKLAARASSELPRGKAPPAEIGTTLAAMRAATDRDDVVRLACEAALTVSRAAVFLALRKGVLKGWEGAGGGISRDAVRNLWIPTSSPSMFKKVIDSGEPYVGAYGTAVADGLFRAAVASRGGIVAIHPVEVADHLVGVLAVDDLWTQGSLPKHRIEILAHAVAEAFKRVLSSKKG